MGPFVGARLIVKVLEQPWLEIVAMDGSVGAQERPYLRLANEPPVAQLDALKLTESGPPANRSGGELHVRGRQQLSRLRK